MSSDRSIPRYRTTPSVTVLISVATRRSMLAGARRLVRGRDRLASASISSASYRLVLPSGPGTRRRAPRLT